MNIRNIILMCVIIGFGVGCERSNVPSSNNNNNNNNGLPNPNPIVNSGKVVSNVLQAKVGDYIFDIAGRKYKKRTDAVISDAWGNADIWERVEPLVTDKWYTPTLGSTIFTNDPPSFNSLFRMEGESEPFFN